jgi:hypothetical protein
MKVFLKFFIVSLLWTFLYSSNSLASQTLIDSYICHDCDFTQAKALASAKYTLPRCDFVDLNGSPSTPDSPMACGVTNETIVILDPQNRLAWKFNVKAHFPQQYVMEVITSNLSMSTTDTSNADIFFDFYGDVVEATDGGLLRINPASFESTQIASSFSSKTSSTFSTLTDDPGGASCFVASEYFRSQTSQSNVENFVEAEVARRVAGKNPHDMVEELDITGLGFKGSGGVGTASVGFDIYWESDERHIAVAIGSGNTKLVFNIALKGSITATDGTYAMNLYLDRNASKIDGRIVDYAMPNGTVNDANSTTTDDYPCLRNILENAAEEAPWGEFVGDGLSGSNVLQTLQNGQGEPSFCVRTVSARTCSTGSDGQTCTTTVYHFPDYCL